MRRENRWVIAYADGTRYRAQDGPATEAPKERVLWIANSGGEPVFNKPIYAYDIEQNWWFGMDFLGLTNRLKTHPLVTIYIFGEQVPKDEWEIIRTEMRVSQ